MGTTTNGHMSPGAQARAQEGVQHLQAAARELIAAARAALDVAEEWVDDPEAVSALVGTLATVGDAARRLAGGVTGASGPAGGTATASDQGDEPRVQRITVT